MPADLYAAIYGTVAGNASLTGSFGRSDWLWIDAGPDGQALPYAVLTQVSDVLDTSYLQAKGGQRRITEKTFDVRVYDDDRETCRALAEAVADVIEAAATAGALASDEGTLIDCERTGTESHELDPDAGPLGQDVWGHSIEFMGMMHKV
jgi:hypothetical protein